MPNLNHRASGFSGLATLMGLGALIYVLVWSYDRKGGMNFDEYLVNLHPPLMVLSMILMSTFAVNSFQTDPMGYGYPKTDRSPNKHFHAIILGIALIIGFAGVYCASAGGVIETKDWPFHQYMGVVTLCLMCSNGLLGYIKFILNYPIFGEVKDYLPTHRNLGILSLISCYIAAISGAYEWGYCGHDESTNDGWGCSDGLLAIFMLGFGLLFVILSLHPEYLHPEETECIGKVIDEVEADIEEKMTGRKSVHTYTDIDGESDGVSTGSGSSYSSYDTDDSSRKASTRIVKHTSSKKTLSRKARGSGRKSDKLNKAMINHDEIDVSMR